MQHAGVDVAEHTVLQVIAIQERSKLLDKVSKVFGRNSSVLDKWLWPGLPFDVAQQTHCALTHRIDTL
ncbi:hypothetical protein D3C85_1885900 [compost metagenome]